MTVRRRLVDWSLTGLLILVPALVLRASLQRGTPSAFDEAILRITAPLEAGRALGRRGHRRRCGRATSRWSTSSRENRELREDNERLRKELADDERAAPTTSPRSRSSPSSRSSTPADTIGARVIAAPLSPQFRVLRLRHRSRRRATCSPTCP